MQDSFGGPDPSVALVSPGLTLPSKVGPLHRIQYVIEFVGPRTVPAAMASQILGPEWFAALGQPSVYVMRPADLNWTIMTSRTDGSYDSIALTWDMVTSGGQMSSASAAHLLRVAEQFGPHIQRRAMPMPPAAEVDAFVKQLRSFQDGLDIGFALSVVSKHRGGFSERKLWEVCSALDLRFESGSFDWMPEGLTMPLLSVTPFGQTDAFSIEGMQRGDCHPGVTIGFSLPLCPAPSHALDGCIHVARVIAHLLGGQVLDESDRALTDSGIAALRKDLQTALSLFSKAGFPPGSTESIRLFTL